MNEYDKQAEKFLASTKTTFETEFLKHGKHFDNDTETRDIYKITLKRGSRVYSFNYGQSINCSGEYQIKESLMNKLWRSQIVGGKYAFTAKEFKNLRLHEADKVCIIKNPNFKAPTAYDVLACLTKYDPGTLENFCSDFGYDTDSRSAEKTYNAVKDEYQNVSMLFTDAEIEQLQEIQ